MMLTYPVVLALVALAIAVWWLWAYRRTGSAEGASERLAQTASATLAAALVSLVVVLEAGAGALSTVGESVAIPWLAHAIAVALGWLALEGVLSLSPLGYLALAVGVAVLLVVVSR